jgi:hypothetical protein
MYRVIGAGARTSLQTTKETAMNHHFMHPTTIINEHKTQRYGEQARSWRLGRTARVAAREDGRSDGTLLRHPQASRPRAATADGCP